jgi:hypothetical protein
MATAIMTQFEKSHKDCEPVWVEPVNDPTGKTEAENAQWWAENGEHGASSITMYNHLCFHRRLSTKALPYTRQSHPSDPNDFMRCYKLLQAVPQWNNMLVLDSLSQLSPQWKNLVNNWSELILLLEEQIDTGKDNRMYKLMQELDRPY